MIEIHTIIEAIYYVLSKIGQSDKLKIVKLIYLADKYHLIKYGRTITNDDYYVMQYGPVGTTVKDFLSSDTYFSSSAEKEFESRLIEKVAEYEYKCRPIRYKIKWLSQSDLEVLDFVIEKFGAKTSLQLFRYSHRYPEWKSYESLFKNKRLRRKRLENRELLSTIKDDLLEMPKEHIETSAEILSGRTS
jgi:uncharacterized phage-associated protein